MSAWQQDSHFMALIHYYETMLGVYQKKKDTSKGKQLVDLLNISLRQIIDYIRPKNWNNDWLKDNESWLVEQGQLTGVKISFPTVTVNPRPQRGPEFFAPSEQSQLYGQAEIEKLQEGFRNIPYDNYIQQYAFIITRLSNKLNKGWLLLHCEVNRILGVQPKKIFEKIKEEFTARCFWQRNPSGFNLAENYLAQLKASLPPSLCSRLYGDILVQAIKRDDLDVVKWLVETKSLVQAGELRSMPKFFYGTEKMYPLHYAAEHFSEKVFVYLWNYEDNLCNQGKPDDIRKACRVDGKTLLHLLIASEGSSSNREQKKIAGLLNKFPKQLLKYFGSIKNNDNQLLIHQAIELYFSQAVKLFLPFTPLKYQNEIIEMARKKISLDEPENHDRSKEILRLVETYYKQCNPVERQPTHSYQYGL